MSPDNKERAGGEGLERGIEKGDPGREKEDIGRRQREKRKKKPKGV